MNDIVKGNRQILLCTAIPLAPSFQHIDFVSISENIAKAANLTPLEWQSFYYPGQGASYHWFLGESHIQLDTYPENHLVEITLVSCQSFSARNVIRTIGDMGWIVKEYSVLEKNEDNRWLPC